MSHYCCVNGRGITHVAGDNSMQPVVTGLSAFVNSSLSDSSIPTMVSNGDPGFGAATMVFWISKKQPLWVLQAYPLRMHSAKLQWHKYPGATSGKKTKSAGYGEVKNHRRKRERPREFSFIVTDCRDMYRKYRKTYNVVYC